MRKSWSDWDQPGEQRFWCRGGAFYPVGHCDRYIHYERDKAVVQDCLEAAVVKYQDGYIQCSMLDVYGCEECYRRFEAKTEGGEDEGMIERDNTNELRGQLDLGDLMAGEGATSSVQEGYDAEGNLLNLDYPTLQKPSPAPEGAVQGKVAAPEAAADEVSTPQTYADPDRLTTLAVEINAITEQTRGVVISAALAVGKRLIEARSICPAGRFGEWLAKSVNYSERKAQDMMRLYVEYGRDGCVPEAIAALDYSKAVALLGAPADEREALAERAASEDLSVRDLNAEIKRLKAEKLKDQMTIDAMEARIDRQKDEIARMDENESKYDHALIEKEDELKAARAAIELEREAARLAQAKATAAEASANELRRLHSDAEDRAAVAAQRASDAVNRANQTAKDLAEAKAKIQALSEAAAAAARNSPEVQTVEVVPEAITKELAELRARLAEQEPRVGNGDTSSDPAKAGPPSPQGEGSRVSASEKFKWFYNNQMKPAFTTALDLLREVAREDPKAADLYATALTRGCQQLMNQLGTRE